MALTLLLLFVWSYMCIGVRASNASASAPPSQDIVTGWVPEPPGRGTWSLLHSCVFTLVLCVWTSIHPNVPAQDEGKWRGTRIFMRKLKWVCVALFAPELVLYSAWAQFKAARDLETRMNKLYECGQSDEEGLGRSKKRARKRENKFNMAYCFYVVMGGFAIDVSYMHDDLRRISLTSDGVHELASRGHFFNVSAECIQDKSKAGILAKGLVLFQAGWLVGQLIARAVARLPITLLEAHTLVHVGCAFIIYVLWWSKPQDVMDPTLIDISNSPCESAIAELLIRSSSVPSNFQQRRGWHGWRSQYLGRSRYYERDPTKDSEMGYEYLYLLVMMDGSSSPSAPLNHSPPGSHKSGKHESSIEQTSESQPEAPNQYQNQETYGSRTFKNGEMFTGDFLDCGIGFGCRNGISPWQLTDLRIDINRLKESRRKGTGELDSSEQSAHTLPPNLFSRFVSKKTIRRWRFAADSLKSSGSLHQHNDLTEILDKPVATIEGLSFQPFAIRHSNVYAPSQSYARASALSLTCLMALYGGVHLSVWSSHFPSTRERALWNASCYVLLGVGSLLALNIFFPLLSYLLKLLTYTLAFILAPNIEPISNFASNWMGVLTSMWVSPVVKFGRYHEYGSTFSQLWAVVRTIVYIVYLVLLFAPPVLCYCAARIYIVAEAFISLRSVPREVYDDVPWTNYIPHF